jgi:predicted KAP-like P-loop ATPase
MLHDNPISAQANDLLHRYPLAKQIAEMINRHKGDESYVVGIEGEWGSGKTSFVNMILEDLQKTSALLVKFNPWNFSDQNQLITDFFESLNFSLKEAEGEGSHAKVEKLKGYASKLLKQSGITIAPEAFGVKLGELKIGGAEEPLEKQKESINKLFKDLGRRVIIVIDDIDRLDSQETKLIFKLVKITGNFANTTFLLAYDREKVSELITDRGIKGSEYLKKIVQVSFTMPKPDPQDLFNILFSDIGKILERFDKKYWDNGRWGNIFHAGLKRFFPTIRDIKRYINSVQLDLDIVGVEEVNPIDFLSIEAIRVFVPEVYMAMADARSIFTTVDTSYASRNEIRQERRREFERIVKDNCPKEYTDILIELIKEIFPQVGNLYTNYYSHGQQQLKWRQQLRVCAEDIFDKYFTLSIPSSTLSEKSLKDIVGKVSDKPAFAESLRIFHEENKLRFVLDRLLDLLDALTKQEKESLIVGLFDFCEKVIDRKHSVADVQDVGTQTEFLGLQVVKRTPLDKRKEFLKRVIDETKSIYFPVWLLGFINEKDEKRELSENQDPLLEKEDMDVLTQLCVDKIRSAATDGSLLTTKNLYLVFWKWEAWGSKEEVMEYVSQVLKTKEGIIALLRGFAWDSVSETAGDRVARSTKKVHKVALKDFTNLGELDKLVQQIDKATLSEEGLETIEAYLTTEKDNSLMRQIL